MGKFLDPDELRGLTGRVHHSAQARALAGMGIEHKPRPDGSLAVLWSHVEAVMGGEVSGKRKKANVEPDWGALSAART